MTHFPIPARRRRAAALALAAALLVLTGCSSSSSSGSGRSSASPSTGGTATITIRDFAFGPATLTVHPGAKVTVTNEDTTDHTVTATTGALFDTGHVAPGRTTTFTAPGKAGTYAYRCAIHQFMTGSLEVS